MAAMPSSQPEPSLRLEDVRIKHDRVAELLDEHKADGVLLSRADNFAWMTSGGSSLVAQSTDTGVATLWITKDERVLLTNNIESQRLAEEQLPDLGFEFREYAWHDDPATAIYELIGDSRAVSDTGQAEAPNVMEDLRRLRMRLTDLERQRYREFGREMSECVERTLHRLKPGMTELEVAGGLAHRMWIADITPVVVLVAADERISQYRHPTPTTRPIGKTVMLAAVGRRYGLHASLTRMAHFGEIPAELRDKHVACTLVDASMIFFSRPGEPCAEVFRRAQRLYEKTGHADEWMLHHQGGVIGYAPREIKVTPDMPLLLKRNIAMAWNPSITGTKSEDTICIDDDGYEIITKPVRWPTLKLSVKGYMVRRPDILSI
jgi:Xaa-Pro aminopeptidase